MVLAEEGDGQQRPVAGGGQRDRAPGSDRSSPSMSAICTGSRRAAARPRMPSPLGMGRWRMRVHELRGEVVARPQQAELLGALVVLVDGAAVRLGQLVGARGDGGQHGLQVQGGAQRLTHLAERRQLLHRPAQLGRARLQLGEEANVLDGDDRLVGEGLQQLDLLVRERRRTRPRISAMAPMRPPSRSMGTAERRSADDRGPRPDLGEARVDVGDRTAGPADHRRRALTARSSIAMRVGRPRCGAVGYGRTRLGLRARPVLVGGVLGHQMHEQLAVEPHRHAQPSAVAQPDRALGDRVEHGLNVRRRAADHAQDLAGGRLLRQGPR